ncbi:hypothetical protein BDP27DRAFT_1335154, partial [Rhodocollybia butyracea]
SAYLFFSIFLFQCGCSVHLDGSLPFNIKITYHVLTQLILVCSLSSLYMLSQNPR